MNRHWIKCKNDQCNNRLRLESNNEYKPILFCSQKCLNSYLFQNEELNANLNYEDPNQVRELVQNLLSQTKEIQNELKNLKRIRKTYFGLFKNHDLKRETYERKWSFDDQ
jgi:hypothetical protein